MSRTVRIYNPVIRFNSTLTNVEFQVILNTITNNARENNLRKIEGYPTIINKYQKNYDQLDQTGISIWKFRDNYKPFAGELNSSQLAPINNTLVEVTNFIYDSFTNCICFEFNREGTSEKDFEKYINTFLPSGYTLELKKVYDELTLEDIYRSTRIRSLELKLDLSSNAQNLLKENFIPEQDFLDRFWGIVNASQNLGTNMDAKFAYWKIDLGRGRGTFNLESFRTVIDALNLDSEKIGSIKVKVDRNDGITEYDLKDIGKHYNFKILENSSIPVPAPSYILDTLQQTYDQVHRTNLLRSNARHNLQVHTFNFQQMLMMPTRENQVEVSE